MPTRLLVGPLAGHEDRDVDLVDEGDRRHRVGDLRPVVVVALDLLDQVDRLGVKVLVGRADLVAVLDLLVRPGLAAGRGRGLGIVHAVHCPLEGEARVQDPARIERRLAVVDHRQRRDRGQVGWVGLADEELADAAVGDAHQPDLAVEHPGLAGHRFDHVVSVQRLEPLEVVERAARAAGAAHVHVDHREAEDLGDRLDRALRPAGVRVAVPRVLDERGVGTLVRGAREVDVDRELGPVPGREVAVAAGGQRLVVDLRAGGAGRSVSTLNFGDSAPPDSRTR